MDSFENSKDSAAQHRDEPPHLPGWPTDGPELVFPVTFDLRIIYVLANGATIIDDLEKLYASMGVPCSLIQGIAKPGARYGRMGSRITLSSREQMYALYGEIGKLPYVKAAI
ncbi:MAG: hypothetical protein Q8M76_16985 [Spirochaetaceae bacterium]|nr:hypothetical protein [Spirochaetaceae bacterium]